MPLPTRLVATLPKQVNVHDSYALSVWARHFNVAEWRIKEAVQAAGGDARRVSQQLQHRE